MIPVRHRLYLQIYVAFVGVALLCLVAAGTAWRLTSDTSRWQMPPQARAAVELIVQDLPDGEAMGPALAAKADQLGVDVAIWSADGEALGRAGEAPELHRHGEAPVDGWLHGPHGPAIQIQLADGRWLAASPRGFVEAHRPWRFAGILGAIAGAMALGCLPLARRITRRLEALEQGVDAWGQGALADRVPVSGDDEVADLARSFNRAADRIEGLVLAQRRVLASTSHELRSPLARLRMALEMLDDGAPGRRAMIDEAIVDIDELDEVIGDLLRVGRMEAADRVERPEPVDLLALVRAEAARVGADALGGGRASEVIIQGDPGLLRRMIRNLLENARRHGGGAAIEATVSTADGRALLTVADRGPGVPDGWAERIFEPFARPDGHREGADGGVGLGLALVRQVAEHHDGVARYRPREGGGSIFEVSLPL